MKPDDFVGYRPHQIRRFLRKGRRPWAPREGPKSKEECSLFPGGNVRLLTSAPEWAFGPNPPPIFSGDPTRIATLSERSESKGADHPTPSQPLASPPFQATDQAGLPGTINSNQSKEIAAPEPARRGELVAREINNMETNENMIDNSDLPAPPEAEDFQEPEIELPLPVINALQEREARRQNRHADPGTVGAGLSQPAVAGPARSQRESNQISLSHHAARCSICQHPDRDAIEQGFLHWESPTLLAYEYGLGRRRAVYRHARAFGLFKKRSARTRRSLEFVIEQAETVTASADSVIRAVRAYSCVSEDGHWTEPTKRVVITHENVDVVRNADSDSSLITSHQSPARRGGLVTASTLGDGHARPSKNAVTHASSTKLGKLMGTLFNGFGRRI